MAENEIPGSSSPFPDLGEKNEKEDEPLMKASDFSLGLGGLRSSATTTQSVPSVSVAGRTDEDYSQEIRQMQEIRRTFSSVINDFEKDTSVETFMNEYKKLYEALKESHSMQKKIMIECSNLRCEIKNNAEKVNLAIHLSQEDKEIISNLTKQVNQAWNEVENLSEKEAKARSVISKLKGEIVTLTSLVEAGSGIQELHSVAHRAVTERKDLEQALVSLKEELEFRDMKISELNDRMQAKDDQYHRDSLKFKDKFQLSEKKRQDLQMKIDDMEDDIKRLERVRSNMISENTTLTMEMEACKTKLSKMEKDELDLRANLTKYTLLYTEQQEVLCEKTKEISKLTADNENWKKRYDSLYSSNNSLKDTLEIRDNLVQANERMLRKKDTEIESLAKKGDQTASLVKLLQRQLLERENELKSDRDNIGTLRTSLNACKKECHKIDMERKRFLRIMEVEKKANLKLITQKGTLEKTLILKNKVNHCLSVELNGMGRQVQKGLEAISTMEMEKGRLYSRINQILEMVNNLASDNDNKESKLMILLKLNNEHQTAIHCCSSKLVRMTNKRDNLGNALHLVQLKNEELTIANVNFAKQSSTLAEELHNKEQIVSDLKKINFQLNGQIGTLRNEIQSLKEEKSVNLRKINELGQKMLQMQSQLCKREHKIGEMCTTVDQIVHQRNVLGYQCSKKMEQVHLLTEKNALMQSFFKAGNRSYNHQQQLIVDLKLNIMNLSRQKMILMNKLENIDNLKSKLGLANQQLVTALSRVRAMEGEHPYNLHRWRYLKAMDISQYEMILKIQHLQKRVIAKTNETTSLERLLLDKTTIVTEMKHALERRPGPEIVAKAKSDREAKEKLDKKLKAAIAERNMYAHKTDRLTSHTRHALVKLCDERKKSVSLNKANIKLKTKVSRLPDIHGPLIRCD